MSAAGFDPAGGRGDCSEAGPIARAHVAGGRELGLHAVDLDEAARGELIKGIAGPDQ